MRSLPVLKALLWFIAVTQFLAGTLLLVLRDPSFVFGLAGADVALTEQFTFMLKPLGAYMVVTGLIASAAARARVPHPSIVFALALLFGLHGVYRVGRFQFIQQAFGVSATLLIIQIVVITVITVALVVLGRAALNAARAEEAGAA